MRMNINSTTLSVGEYSTAYSTNSAKTAFTVGLLKKQLDGMSTQSSTASSASKSASNTVDELNQTISASPLGNNVDIAI
jgi:hypothetical protein